MRLFSAILISLLFFYPFALAEQIVFEGIPDVTNTSSFDQTFNSLVGGDDKTNYKCIITKEGTDYFWFSREKKKLNLIHSGSFLYFLTSDGSGYIKITKLDNGKYMYMESLNMLFKIITYWGTADKIDNCIKSEG